MNNLSNIAAFVKYHREKMNFTQQQLADLSGTGLHFVRDLEQGRSALRLDKVNSVLKLFGHQLSVNPINIDPYQVWMNYRDKSVTIITIDQKEITGFLVGELRNEKSEITGWKLLPHIHAMKWQKNKEETLIIKVNHVSIAEIKIN